MRRDGEHVPFVTTGSYPIRPGNFVRPWVDGAPAFRRICQAVEAARESVWVTVAFLERDMQMPDGRGSFFDVLDRAVDRGLDVRVNFWRSLPLAAIEAGSHFVGNDAERAWLAERGSRFLARWDQAHGRYCQHQKSWLVDAGTPGEVGFVGGINLGQGSVVEPGHPPTDGGNTHDVYVELRGPAVSDVHHNFVQRWNEASDRGRTDGLWPDALSQDDLAFPAKLSPEAGSVPVQIQRTVRRERYRDGRPAPGAESFRIEAGEYSIVDQYLRAIEAARETIYVEDQAVGAPEVVAALHAAAERGVAVVFLVPIDANRELAAARRDPASRDLFDGLAALGAHENFTLAGLATNRGPGAYQNVYVHAKIALVDDVWATIGSANVANRSFYGDTELNASFWCADTVRALRDELLREHLGEDTVALGPREALTRYRDVARQNARRLARGDTLHGLAVELDATTYAT